MLISDWSSDVVASDLAEMVMTMKTDFGFRLQGCAQCRDARGDHVRKRGARAVGAVDRLGAIAFHQECLLHERINRGHVRHHEEADGVEAELAAKADIDRKSVV